MVPVVSLRHCYDVVNELLNHCPKLHAACSVASTSAKKLGLLCKTKLFEATLIGYNNWKLVPSMMLRASFSFSLALFVALGWGIWAPFDSNILISMDSWYLSYKSRVGLNGIVIAWIWWLPMIFCHSRCIFSISHCFPVVANSMQKLHVVAFRFFSLYFVSHKYVSLPFVTSHIKAPKW